MRDFKNITAEIKLHLSLKKTKKVFDKDVADALGLSQANFATLKRRNSTPYKHVLEFCYKEDFCCNEIFFKS